MSWDAGRPLLEVIALDAADARAASAGGADRIELVADMAADGLSPAVATAREVLAVTDLPVRVMLRDAAGFAPRDLAGLRRTAAALRAAGVREFVLGFLDAGGGVDAVACEEVLAELDGCRWTFHRALDHADDPENAWHAVSRLGCDTVLAAGSPQGVTHGMAVLARLAARQAGDGVELMVGGGLRTEHVAPLRAAGVRSFHVGSLVRSAGWSSPVDPARVAEFRALLTDSVPA
ncbi:copper homeostasis protein [Longimycelium tulufanense]|uniref:Copper homeostasis protein cutC homolog n=1 Tax=Longimycelium tulufanense TaxID=907463 RepID=A0A8J3FUH8_9PSEU|nr:copper homeostasis protein CutC [Longimycelium tulufanense]GGM43661.1 copper homeostasis protein [Longimycelium tulufanense]